MKWAIYMGLWCLTALFLCSLPFLILVTFVDTLRFGSLIGSLIAHVGVPATLLFVLWKGGLWLVRRHPSPQP
jgi:hypothetical protein